MERYKKFDFQFKEEITKTKSGKYKGVYKDKPRYFDTKEDAEKYEKEGTILKKKSSEIKSQNTIDPEEVKSLYKKLGGHLGVLRGTKSPKTKNQMEKKIGIEIVEFLHNKVKQMKEKGLSDKEIKNEILKMKKLPGDGVFRSEITRYLSLYFK